ncbi:hypothetical protein WJ32_14740 [Burkholderia ubonensis]|uniref:Ketopantoate reductase C-terminal domain-containing protein n=1 Tax=Burkholderia ubonensis TaxID=101571 RepID=A0A103RTB6_9BURK|nr:hypothetical protein WJ32_14740 [Burkholderia ubonensis]KVG73607.1 hypothetical protein WJ33_16285 [Burkholderia ubonensis]
MPAAWIPAVLDAPDPLFRMFGARMLAIDPLARSSMSDVLAARRPTEVEWINGEVVRLVEGFRATVPVNARRRAVGRAGGMSAGRQTIACRCDAVQ